MAHIPILKNKHDKPNCKPSELYALQESGRFVVATHAYSEAEKSDIRETEKASEARRFIGVYLNTTIWDWSLYYIPIQAKYLNELIAKEKKTAKENKSTKK